MPARWATLAAVALLTTLAGLAAAADAPPGAAACSGCHPPGAGVDTPVPPLTGRPADEIVTAMQGFRSGQVPGTVMDRIAKGFSDQEVRAIAAWFAAQK